MVTALQISKSARKRTLPIIKKTKTNGAKIQDYEMLSVCSRNIWSRRVDTQKKMKLKS